MSDSSFSLSNSLSESSDFYSFSYSSADFAEPLYSSTGSAFRLKAMQPLPPPGQLRHWDTLDATVQAVFIRFLNFVHARPFVNGVLVPPVKKKKDFGRFAALQEAVRCVVVPAKLQCSRQQLNDYLTLYRSDGAGVLSKLGFLHAFVEELLSLLQIYGFPTAAYVSDPTLFDAATPLLPQSASSSDPASTLEEAEPPEMDIDAEGLPLACYVNSPPALMTSSNKRRLQL